MEKTKCRYIFHNPNSKDDMEEMWITCLTEIYTLKLKGIFNSCNLKEASGTMEGLISDSAGGERHANWEKEGWYS